MPASQRSSVCSIWERERIGSSLGCHRLRNHVGTFITRVYKSENMGSTYLRHADRKKESATLRKHYLIPLEYAELPTVSDEEILQWGRRHGLRREKLTVVAA